MNAWTALSAVLLVTALALSVGIAPGSASTSAQEGITTKVVAVDAITDGNTATTLGPRDSCVRTEAGSTVTVDLTVDSIPAARSLVGFEMDVTYDRNLLEVIGVNNDLLLGSVGNYQPFAGLADPVPDSDGIYHASIVDLASNDPAGANMETGSGVLSRITFRAKAAGRTDVGVVFNPPIQYPLLFDNQNIPIGVDSIARTVVAIGQDCGSVPPEQQVTPLPPYSEVYPNDPTTAVTPGPTGPTPTGGAADGTPTPSGGDEPTASSDQSPEPSPSPTPTPVIPIEGGSDGSDAGSIVAAIGIVGLGVALAGSGGWLLYRRRRLAQA